MGEFLLFLFTGIAAISAAVTAYYARESINVSNRLLESNLPKTNCSINTHQIDGNICFIKLVFYNSSLSDTSVNDIQLFNTISELENNIDTYPTTESIELQPIDLSFNEYIKKNALKQTVENIPKVGCKELYAAIRLDQIGQNKIVKARFRNYKGEHEYSNNLKIYNI